MKPAQKIHISLPPDWHQAIAAAAADSGQTFSEYLRQAVRRQLPPHIRRQLSTPTPRGRQPRTGATQA